MKLNPTRKNEADGTTTCTLYGVLEPEPDVTRDITLAGPLSMDELKTFVEQLRRLFPEVF